MKNYIIPSQKSASMEGSLVQELFDNQEEYRVHTPYSHEVAMLSCVRDGDLARLELTYRTLPQTKYGQMSTSLNPLKQLFYGSIANVTLVTRYAIEGGLEEETAFTLSDVYIKQMENCRTLEELNALNELMAVDFTSRVAQAKAAALPAYSKPITQCMDYIYKNSHSKITLSLLANVVNLTEKYLSALFHKETGQTLSAFIEEKRVGEAKNLLIYSQYSYSRISEYLSFSSQSYFISVFKKNTGMTPKEYRETYARSVW